MKKQSKRIMIVWIAIWFLIYVAFLILGAFKETDIYATMLKYIGLILCFLYVLIYSRQDVFLVIALGVTLVADGLLIFDNVSLLGVGVFITVQAVHFIRFTQIRAVSPLFTLLATALVIVIGMLQSEIPLMFVLAMAYAVLMFTNIYQATRWYAHEKNKSSRNAMIGFVLFLLCDICVGVSYVTTTATLPHMVTMVANYMAWVFYLPAQVLLALSGERVADFEKVKELPKIDIDSRGTLDD